MIVRIVRLSFVPEKVDEFLQIFEASKTKIAHFDGCTYLSLMKDAHESNVYFTVSNWENLSALQNYRESLLFKETWSKTKALFNDKPQAYSLNMLQNFGSWQVV